MSYSHQGRQKEVAAIANMAVAGDAITLTPAVPIELLEIGFVVTTALVDTAGDGLVLSADLRPTAGSDTGRVANGLGSLTLTQPQAGMAAGKVARSRFAEPALVLPGQQAVIKLSNAVATSGAAIAFAVFREASYSNDKAETLVAA